MGIEENKAIVNQFRERMSKGDTSAIDELMTTNCVLHALGATPTRDFNREEFRQMLENAGAIWSDMSVTYEDIIAEGDKVVIRATRSGKHTGKLNNIEPTGKTVTVVRFSVFRIEDGKIAEMWNMDNLLSQFQQLGVIPPFEEIGK